MFDSLKRHQLFEELRTGPSSPDDEGYRFVLSATPSGGEAGDYGVSFAGTSLALKQYYENITSVLRLEFPWNLLDTVDVERLVGFFARTATIFPFCVGHAGMSFIHTISYVPEARDEVHKLGEGSLASILPMTPHGS